MGGQGAKVQDAPLFPNKFYFWSCIQLRSLSRESAGLLVVARAAACLGMHSDVYWCIQVQRLLEGLFIALVVALESLVRIWWWAVAYPDVQVILSAVFVKD